MPHEMTPKLLALLSPEQQEAWDRCQRATPGPWFIKEGELSAETLTISPSEAHDANMALCADARVGYPAALLELAQTKQALAGKEAIAVNLYDRTAMLQSALAEAAEDTADLEAAAG